MRWSEFGYVEYLVYRNDEEEWCLVDELLEYNEDLLEYNKSYKEETKEEQIKTEDITLEKAVTCTFREMVEGKQRFRITMNEG